MALEKRDKFLRAEFLENQGDDGKDYIFVSRVKEIVEIDDVTGEETVISTIPYRDSADNLNNSKFTTYLDDIGKANLNNLNLKTNQLQTAKSLARDLFIAAKEFSSEGSVTVAPEFSTQVSNLDAAITAIRDFLNAG